MTNNCYYHAASTFKKNKRNLMKVIRALNKNVWEDDWWQGRFYIKLDKIERYRGVYLACIKIHDKKVGGAITYMSTINHWLSFNGYDLWKVLNEFICDRTRGELYKDREDFRYEPKCF